MTSSKVVLAWTEDPQRDMGMVNNRIFDAMSCGAAIVSDFFPALEEVIGSCALLAEGPEQAATMVTSLLSNSTRRRELGEAGRRLVLDHHSYDDRVRTILEFYDQLVDQRRGLPMQPPRTNAPSVVLLYSKEGEEKGEKKDWGLHLALIPSLVALETQGHIHLFLHQLQSIRDIETILCNGHHHHHHHHHHHQVDIVLLRARLGDLYEEAFQQARDKCSSSRHVRRWGVLLRQEELWCSGGGGSSSSSDDMYHHLARYDLVGHEAPWPPPLSSSSSSSSTTPTTPPFNHLNHVRILGVHGITPSSTIRYSRVYYAPPPSLLPDILATPGMTVVLKPSWDSNNQQQNADEYWLDNETLVLHHPSVETALVVMGESESLYIDPTAPGASTLI